MDIGKRVAIWGTMGTVQSVFSDFLNGDFAKRR